MPLNPIFLGKIAIFVTNIYIEFKFCYFRLINIPVEIKMKFWKSFKSTNLTSRTNLASNGASDGKDNSTLEANNQSSNQKNQEQGRKGNTSQLHSVSTI